MKVEEIQSILESHKSELAALGVQELLLFGSAARGEATPQSDLDFLVKMQHYSFQNFMDLKFALEHWFNKKVDLGTLQQLKPVLRDSIQKDLLRVA
jgi:uncharacterized protein